MHREPGFALVVGLAAILCAAAPSPAAERDAFEEWDFAIGTHGWTGNAQVAGLRSTAEGLVFRGTGVDPWIEGPPVDFPDGRTARVRVRMRSTGDGVAEIFYGPRFVAGRSVPLAAPPDGEFHEATAVIPEIGPGTRFRLDPAGGAGEFAVAWIRIDLLPAIEPPALVPAEPIDGAGPPYAQALCSGPLVLGHRGRGWGDFDVLIDGPAMGGAGYRGDLLGIASGGDVRWLSLAAGRLRIDRSGEDRFVERCRVEDPAGGAWEFERSFAADPARAGVIDVEATVRPVAGATGQVLHVPWLTFFPGLGSFGAAKDQALLPGLEYLADEPSSSDIDIAGPQRDRRVPDPVKVTIPMMAFARSDRWLAVEWTPGPATAVVFDSPDRTFGGDAHLAALWGPGVGELRTEGSLFAHAGMPIGPDGITARFRILGGRGATVADAVRRYVEISPLPPRPAVDGAFAAATDLLARGWLDSSIGGADRPGEWRHAVWGDRFEPGPAADVPVFLAWLVDQRPDGPYANRLRAAMERTLTVVNERDPAFTSGVSHVRPPAGLLLFGDDPVAALDGMVERIRQFMATQFDDEGVCRYAPKTGGDDLGRGHFADHANGLAFAVLRAAADAACLSGDDHLRERFLDHLDRQTDLYRGAVPRGAQTWEVPLHTPDILAAAHLVHTYVRAYEMTGRPAYLEEARYWAWTGVPFVYLVAPVTDGDGVCGDDGDGVPRDPLIGSYSTIAVYGATHRKAPVWFGLPVQWCGLVYASAVHGLAPHDPGGPWGEIACGITAAGFRMSWPDDDPERRGLLPDLFHLRAQRRDGPAINPGTVQASIPELFDRSPLYSFQRLPRTGWYVNAPCGVDSMAEDGQSVEFTTTGCGDREYRVLVSRMRDEPAQVEARTPSTDPEPAETRYIADRGWLFVRCRGPVRIRITVR